MSNPRDILIIEDSADVMYFMSEALQEDGHIVRSAYNSEQGLHQIEFSPPALVLLNLHMPGITATEFLERLHSTASPCMPVVIMTTNKVAAHYLAIPCNGTYLVKPFDLETLLACVHRFVPPPRAPQA
jgi:DNA-binding response OmpR family regulator